MESVTMEQKALKLASRGYAVFPLIPNGKKPLIPKAEGGNGYKDATTEERKIRAWWTRTPNANIGIACGLSGLCVVDLDVKHPPINGIDEWDNLMLQKGIDDSTATVITPTGGQHRYFKRPEGVEITDRIPFMPGVDIKANGGYIVSPGSIVDGKTYELEGSPKVNTLPQGILDLLQTETKKEPLTLADEIPNGSRNVSLFKFACSLRARGMSHDEILAALTAYNMRCVPPKAQSVLETIAGSAAKYEQGTQTFRCTDVGNAERLIYHFGEDLLHCWDFGKWFVWDGTRWVLDNGAMILASAQMTVRKIYQEASQIEDKSIRERVAAHARASEASHRIRAMVEQARSKAKVTPDQLDQDKWLLNVENGTLDLRTGKLLPHSREHLITKMCPVTYDPHATCPEWITFLDRIMNANDDLIGFLRRAIGYTLTADTGERAMFILHGTGANGKSTLIATIKNLLGDYGLRTPTQTLMAKRGNSVPNDVARLKGARFVFANESDEQHKLAEATIKDLTGNDTVSARFMRAEWFDFRPVCKLWLATNHKPKITGTDNAIWSRLRLIPFDVTIPDDEQDKDLENKLKAELGGILNWALQGCLDWQRQGLGTPKAVKDATSNYRKESDAIGQFLAETCIEGANAKVSVKALYQEYLSWTHVSGEIAIKKTAFAQRMRERGFISERGAGNLLTWYRVGLAQ